MARVRRPQVAGFTLIEVMVALAVISIAFSDVLKSVNSTVHNGMYLRDRTFAHWVALNEVGRIQVRQEWLAPGATEGTSQMAGQEWRWSVTVQDTPDPAVRRIEIAVRADPATREALSTLVGYLARPAGPAS